MRGLVLIGDEDRDKQGRLFGASNILTEFLVGYDSHGDTHSGMKKLEKYRI
jgi:hypothetical protein